MTKFHINKNGIPSPCRAKPGNCPLGGNENHFTTKEEAQTYVDELHKKEFDILPIKNNNVIKRKTVITEKTILTEKTTIIEEKIIDNNVELYRKANSQNDFDYIKARKDFLKNESDKKTYIERCKSCRKLRNYRSKSFGTKHFNEDRSDKAKELTKHFGEGNTIGHYEVNHLVGKIAKNKYKKQIVELRDNGRIIIYDKNSGKIVTTFMAHRSRVEAMMIMSNEIPNQDFLDNIAQNRIEAAKYKLS